MDHNIYLEDFLYSFVDELSREDAPIIFKGGLALKDLLYLYNSDLNIDRKTIDIDGNWIDTYNIEEITKTLETALNNIEPSFKLEMCREPGENQSIGFNILDSNSRIFTKIDLDIKDNPFYIECTVNDVNRKYSSFEKIMADKLSSLSGTHVFRRVKDLLDVYLITQNKKININEVYEILKYDNRELGDFSTLLNNKELIRDSYDKMQRVINKPSFDTVWDDVTQYLKTENLIELDQDNGDIDI